MLLVNKMRGRKSDHIIIVLNPCVRLRLQNIAC